MAPVRLGAEWVAQVEHVVVPFRHDLAQVAPRLAVLGQEVVVARPVAAQDRRGQQTRQQLCVAPLRHRLQPLKHHTQRLAGLVVRRPGRGRRGGPTDGGLDLQSRGIRTETHGAVEAADPHRANGSPVTAVSGTAHLRRTSVAARWVGTTLAAAATPDSHRAASGARAPRPSGWQRAFALVLLPIAAAPAVLGLSCTAVPPRYGRKLRALCEAAEAELPSSTWPTRTRMPAVSRRARGARPSPTIAGSVAIREPAAKPAGPCSSDRPRWPRW